MMGSIVLEKQRPPNTQWHWGNKLHHDKTLGKQGLDSSKPCRSNQTFFVHHFQHGLILSIFYVFFCYVFHGFLYFPFFHLVRETYRFILLLISLNALSLLHSYYKSLLFVIKKVLKKNTREVDHCNDNDAPLQRGPLQWWSCIKSIESKAKR